MDIGFLLGLGVDESAAASILEAFENETQARLADASADAEILRLRDKFGYALQRSLERMGARNINAASAALDFEWDGCDFDTFPPGLCEAVARLKHDEPYLFRDGVVDGTYESMPRCSFVGITPVEPSDTDVSGEELSYSEYMRLYHNV